MMAYPPAGNLKTTKQLLVSFRPPRNNIAG